LQRAANERDSYAITPWIAAIRNHLYWCATSCRDEEGEVKVAKWTSILNHIQDVHEGHDPLYLRCLHGPLSPKKWIEKGEHFSYFTSRSLLAALHFNENAERKQAMNKTTNTHQYSLKIPKATGKATVCKIMEPPTFGE
jgi:hypothetical protein